MTRTSTDTYTFEIPTHVAEEIGKKEMWIETPHGKDYWELMWDDQKEDYYRIERGEINQVHNDFEGAEFTVIDKVAELKEDLEKWKAMYYTLREEASKLRKQN